MSEIDAYGRPKVRPTYAQWVTLLSKPHPTQQERVLIQIADVDWTTAPPRVARVAEAQ